MDGCNSIVNGVSNENVERREISAPGSLQGRNVTHPNRFNRMLFGSLVVGATLVTLGYVYSNCNKNNPFHFLVNDFNRAFNNTQLIILSVTFATAVVITKLRSNSPQEEVERLIANTENNLDDTQGDLNDGTDNNYD
ncbi:MAG: hypothetical protein KDK78_01020, partial [Chlamydiia bacterium]|nr:hypothetical protein [Chlamydiia bacterium]